MTEAAQASNQYEDVEGQLQESFRPVIPDPEFVRRLYHRLTTTPSTVVERRPEAGILLAIALSILTGAVVMLLAKRVVEWLAKRL